MDKNIGQLLTAKEVSELIKVSVGTMENWRLANKGPKFIRLGGTPRGKVRYRLQDVEDWMFDDSKGEEE